MSAMNPAPARARSAILLSVVVVVDRWASQIPAILPPICARVGELVADYEIILIENGPDPASDAIYESLTSVDGLPNIQIYRLLRAVEFEVAAWSGVENSLGDYVLVMEPFSETIAPLEDALDAIQRQSVDLVLIVNDAERRERRPVRILRKIYVAMFRALGGADLQVEASQFRLMSKRVVSFLLEQPRPAQLYRALPATAGFAKAVIRYSAPRQAYPARNFWGDVRRAVRLLFGNSIAPARIASSLSLAGAALNILYSLYVLVMAFTRTGLQPGWVTLSLQQSGMFFLFSVLAFVLTEYMVENIRFGRSGSPYFITREWTSAVLTRQQRLNVTVPDVVGEASGVARGPTG